jgi:hypothetical protein
MFKEDYVLQVIPLRVKSVGLVYLSRQQDSRTKTKHLLNRYSTGNSITHERQETSVQRTRQEIGKSTAKNAPVRASFKDCAKNSQIGPRKAQTFIPNT